jgi:abequosyltransferase
MFLSICIPTYKRAEFLRAALDSIIPILEEDIEIVICDNASLDGTRELVENYQKKNPQIVFYEWPNNMGADRNYLEVINRARGEYCWFLGSDDAIIPEILPELRQVLIASRCDVLVADRYDCDYHMYPLNEKTWFDRREMLKWDFREDGELLGCVKEAKSLGALFSYLSSVIVRRGAWSSRVDYAPLIGTAYSHVGMILSGLREGGRSGAYLYFPKSIVYNRGGNDSFRGKSVARRYLLDVVGYRKVFEWSGFVENTTRQALKILIEKEHFGAGTLKCIKGLSWIKAKSDPADWRHLVMEWELLGVSKSSVAIVKLIPRPLLLVVRLCSKLV